MRGVEVQKELSSCGEVGMVVRSSRRVIRFVERLVGTEGVVGTGVDFLDFEGAGAEGV